MYQQQFATFNPQQQQQQQLYARAGSANFGAQQFATAPHVLAGPAAALAAWAPPSPQELQFYDALFAVADEEKRGAIGGQLAVAFFSRSKLDKLVLREVWNIADSQKRSELSRNEFFVAMRLIAMAQRGEPVSLQRFFETAAMPHALPILEGVPQPQMHAMPAPVGMGPPMSATQHAVPGHPGAPAPPHSSGGYAVTDEEKGRYDVIFKQYDADGDGFLLGSEAVALFQMSGLDRNALRDIWTMADKGQDSKLDLQEFYAAMHLIVCVSKRNLPLPSALPQELHDSVFGPSPTISTGFGAPTSVTQQAPAPTQSGDPMDAFAELSAPVNDAPLPSLSPPEPARTASFHPEPSLNVGGAEPAHHATPVPENLPSRRNSGASVDGSRHESNSGWPAVQPPPVAPMSVPATRERTGSASSMSSMSSFTGIAPPVRAMGSNDRLNSMGGHPPPHPPAAGAGGMMAGGYGMSPQMHPTAPNMPQAGYGIPGGAPVHVAAPPKPFMSEDEEQSAVRELEQQNESLADSIAKVESKQKAIETLTEKLRDLDQLRHELVTLVMKREKLRAATATSAASIQPEEDPAEAQTRLGVERSLRQLVEQEKQQVDKLQSDISRLEAKLQSGSPAGVGSTSSAAASGFGDFAAASGGSASASFGNLATTTTTSATATADAFSDFNF